MLNESQLEDLYKRLDLSELCRQIINEIRSKEPLRRVSSSFGNVSGSYPSKKMGWTIQFESRTVELPAIELFYEYNSDVIEYWDQAYKFTLKVKSSSGKNCTIAHVPDFFIIKENSVIFEEWKPETKLEELAVKYPDRYMIGEDSQWHNFYAEEFAKKLGIDYRLRSNREIDWVKYRNLKYLRGYIDKKYVVSESIAVELITTVTSNPGITFAQLRSQVNSANSDDINALIAEGKIYVDLSAVTLTEQDKVHTFRDQSTSSAYSIAFNLPTTNIINSITNICEKPGSTVIWDGKVFTVATKGDKNIYLRGEEGLVSLTNSEFETLVHLEEIKGISQEKPQSDYQEEITKIFLQASPNALELALRRYSILQAYFQGESSEESIPIRTLRFWKSKYKQSESTYGCGLIGLIDKRKGNSTSRYSDEAWKIIDKVIEDNYENFKQKNALSVYNMLKTVWLEKQVSGQIIEDIPSQKTFYLRLKKHGDYKQIKKRRGTRAAYKKLPPRWMLEMTTPRHGDRPFEIVHIDHTQLDIEIICPRTGKNLGRPWVTAMMDGYSRRILAVYITFDPPSYRSCMMILRICVQRFGRLPETIIVDNGKEFKSIYFDTLLARFETTKMHRPPDMPRFSSIIERWFSTNNTQFINNLRGNTQIMKYVRLVKKENNPKNLAVWTLDEFYDYFANGYCYGFYDQKEHPALEGLSPEQAFISGLLNSGSRPHQRIQYDEQFRILTLPSTSKGTAKVQPVTGVRINYLDYWSVETSKFRQASVEGKEVPVRYDPFDWAIAYAYVGGIWVRCVASNYVKHQGYSERQVMIASEILRQKRKLYNASTRNDASGIVEILQSAEKYEELALQCQRDLAATDVRNIIENKADTQLQTFTATDTFSNEDTDSKLEIDNNDNDDLDTIEPYSSEELWL
jgi:putative transposase